MAKRTGLGKGLDALIPGGKISVGGEGGVTQVSIDSIQRNPRQPREKFDTAELENLAASIREHGVIQPLIVSPGRGGSYTLIAGERRLQASRKAGLKTVPVVIRSATDQQLLELALIENVQRADLNPIEEAEAYQNLAKEFRMSHETIATRVGKSRVAVTNTLRLLDASAAVKQALVDGRISEGHARDVVVIRQGAGTFVKSDLEFGFEREVNRSAGAKTFRAKPVVKEVRSKSERERRGTEVANQPRHEGRALKHGKRGGTIVIYYYSDEELIRCSRN
ncbi:MAG: ParB/RepB/Spo0J family partition protein [Anaerolineales bacterium]